jgi:hypothetical protein
MEKTLTLIIIFYTCTLHILAQATLDDLDKILDKQDEFIKARQNKINQLKGNYQVAEQPIDQYLSCKQLASAYVKFDSDSAIHYFQECERLGKKYNRPDWVQDALIRIAYVFADRGDRAMNVQFLSKVGNINQVADNMKPLYAKAALMGFIYNISSSSDWVFSDNDYIEAYKRFEPYLDKNDAYYDLFRFESLNQKAKASEAERLEQRRKVLARPGSYEEALLELLIATSYYTRGDKASFLPHAIQSAIDDIKCANHSSSSFIYLVSFLIKEGIETDRATKYIEVCLNNVDRYKDLGRSTELAHLTQQLNANKEKRLHLRLIAGWSLAVVLALTLFALIMKKRKQMKTFLQEKKEAMTELERLKPLGEVNRKLSTENQQMKKKIKELENRVDAIEQMPPQLLIMTGNMVNAIHKTKKTLANLIVAKSYTEAHHLATSQLMKDEVIEQICEAFDKMVLQLHPDFPERFNALLKPEVRVDVSDGKLTPEMRIYALISMGITDSVTIAEVLQYSTQTVYNYRLKVRHSTLTPNFDIAGYVAKMYRREES